MCSNSELLELGRDFRALAARLAESKQHDLAALQQLRHRFARRCRSSQQPVECLRRQHLAGIAELQNLAGPALEPPLGAARAAEVLPRDSVYDEHGELAMLEVYRARIQASGDIQSKQGAEQLQALVRSACANGREKLRQRLSWYGLSCGRR